MNNFVQRLMTAFSLACVSYCLWITLSPFYFSGLLFIILGYVLVVEWPQFRCWWLTPLYPITPFLACIDLYLNNQMLWAWLVLVVVAYDSGGYLFGKLFGSIKIAPFISPGKTVQGFVGGVLCAGLMSICISALIKAFFDSILIIYAAGAAVGVIAFLGDLFESYLKRLAGVKDSGRVLPGHGGVLDRIDGILLAAFVVNSIFNFIFM